MPRFSCAGIFFESEILQIKIEQTMKQKLHRRFDLYWRSLQYWMRRLIKGKDDDDHPFNHPWAIL